MTPERPMSETMPETMSATVHIRIVHRGATLEDSGTLHLEGGTVRVAASRRHVRAALDRLAGMTWSAPHLVLHTLGGDTIDAEGTMELAAIADAITSRVCAVPEMTRALRSFGAARHDAAFDADELFVATLLAARRTAELAATLEARLAAFEPRAMRGEIEDAIARAAAVRHPESPPHRRAMEAVLLDAAEPLFLALERLSDAEGAVRASAPAARFVAWRQWVLAARGVFEGADRACASASRELAAAAGVW
jgi:hypothetical protein